ADSYESLRKEWIDTANEITKVLKTITDEASAKDAGPKLKKLKAKLDDINDRKGKLPRVPVEEIAAAEKKYKKELDAALQNWFQEEQRVGKIKGAKEVLKNLK